MDIDKLFERFITESLDELPQDYIKNLNNVAITTSYEPDKYQVKNAELKPNSLLFGLYEGIPLTKRGSGATMALPDKITLFKNAIMYISKDEVTLKANIKRTLWHEIAHYYGLSHEAMVKLQQDVAST